MLFAALHQLTSLRDSSSAQSASSASVAESKDAENSSNKLTNSEEIVNAMNKLDAKLVAYLAGEEMLSNQQQPLDLKVLNEKENISHSPLDQHVVGEIFDNICPEQRLEVFQNISGIRLNMEALTLQSEGTKCMELLQTEIRPIFTVECQLSHELIQQVERYDMFQILQFESEKFQSLTQCTRFGQEEQRQVKLNVDSLMNGNKPNLGRIHFTVWWREPGTCLNEMLGMGLLDLEELYNASLLEQCKCITINRRGIHLASIYCKISLQLPSLTLEFNNYNIQKCNGGGGDEQKENQQKSGSSQAAEIDNKFQNAASLNAGDYAEKYLYFKDDEIQ